MTLLYVALAIAALAYGKTLVDCIAYEIDQYKAAKEHQYKKF